MIETILMCLLMQTPTPSDMSEYISCRRVEEKVQYVVEWHDVIAEYFEPEDVLQAMLVVFCESSGKPNAVGVNTNGTTDVGLWQFNDDTWAWLTPKLNIKASRSNPIVSTRIASWLVYNDGWHHWNSSKGCWNEEYIFRP
jgi:hypothetical protein